MKKAIFLILAFLTLSLTFFSAEDRPRMREFGIETGIIEPGEWNAITDVPGVKVTGNN
jgi:D-aminopeptidase